MGHLHDGIILLVLPESFRVFFLGLGLLWFLSLKLHWDYQI